MRYPSRHAWPASMRIPIHVQNSAGIDVDTKINASIDVKTGVRSRSISRSASGTMTRSGNVHINGQVEDQANIPVDFQSIPASRIADCMRCIAPCASQPGIASMSHGTAPVSHPSPESASRIARCRHLAGPQCGPLPRNDGEIPCRGTSGIA